MNTTNHLLDGGALDAGAVKFDFKDGFPFVYGIQAPVYIDTRRMFFDPAVRDRTIDAMVATVKGDNISYDIIAGVESGAIAPAVLLASALKKPFVYVKKKPKDHGLKRMIECGDVAGLKVLLIEDMVSTGGTSLNAIRALREAGATVTDEITIHRYEFPESDRSFPEAGVTLHPVALVADIAREAGKRGIISNEEVERLVKWLPKPNEPW